MRRFFFGSPAISSGADGDTDPLASVRRLHCAVRAAFHHGVNRDPLIELRAVSCRRTGAGVESCVADVSLAISPASVTVLAGADGCGKNLILELMGLIEVPDSGEIVFDGDGTNELTEDSRAELRSNRCGYVFDSPFLLSSFSVLENVAMPAFKISQVGPQAAQARTEDLIAFTGLSEFANAKNLPPALQHRVALARALVNDPAVVFVQNLDGFLEPQDVPAFRRLLHGVPARYGVAVVVSAGTGLPHAAGERRIEIAHGRVLDDILA